MKIEFKRKIGSLLTVLLLAVGQYVPFLSLLTPNYAFASEPEIPSECPAGIYNVIEGTGGNDVLSGTSGNDFILGYGGTNTISGNGGDDCIVSGDGNDTITTQDGNDVILSGGGTNHINAGGGNNYIVSGGGNDTIIVGDGNDTIEAGNGTNNITAGEGYNLITTGEGNDTITTGDGDYPLYAGGGTNHITIGDGDHNIYTGGGNDTIVAGSGNYIIEAGNGTNNITTGDGNHEIYTGGGNDTITTGDGNDQIYAGGGTNHINAGGGMDLVITGGGNDNINGGADFDVCVPGSGNNTVTNCESDDEEDYNSDTTPPAVPELVSPADGAVIKPSAAILDWTDVSDPSGPVTYWYQSLWSGGGHYGPVSTGTNSFINATGSADRVYQWQVQACDSAPVPNCSSWSPLWEVTIDGTVPPTPTIVFPSDEQYFTSQPILNDWTDVVDNLSGLDYYRIQYAYDDGHTFSGFPYRTTTASQRNHVPAIGEQGGVKFRVQAFDNAGNEGGWSEWRHYYYDASDPWTVFTSPSNGQFFNDPIHIAGVSEDNPEFGGIVDWVDLFYSISGDNDWQPLVTNSNPAGDEPFSWGTDWTPLADGSYDLKAIATDRAGNEEGTAYVYGIVYDTADPVVEITSPTETFLNGTVEIRGSVTDDNPHHYWLVIDGLSAAQVGAVNGANYGVVNDSSSFTDKFFFNWDTTTVSDGTYTIKLEARDAADNKSGNPGVSYDWVTVTVDNTPPATPDPVSPADGTAIKGIAFTQTWTAVSSAVLYGYQSCNTDPGDLGAVCSSVKYTNTYAIASKFVAAGQPNSHFWWRVRAKDAVGNWSAYGPSFELIIDNSAPVTTLDALVSDPTGDSTPTFTGQSNDVYLAGVSLVEYKIADSDSSAVVVDWTATGVFPADGDFDEVSEDFSIVPASLADGNYTIYVRATDRAGNVESTAILSFTVDTTAPAVTWNSPLDGDELSGDLVLFDADAVDLWLSGGISYFYKVLGADDSTLISISSPWDLTLVPLGYYTLVAQALDLAGNSGEARIDIAVKAVVSNEAAGEATTTSFTVTWTTDKPTTSRVVYDTVSHPVLGDAPNYGYAFSTATFDDPVKVTSHSVTITGLTPGTTYYFRTVSSGSPTTVGEEQSKSTGDVQGESTEKDGEVLGEVLPQTGAEVLNLALASLAFVIGVTLRRKNRPVRSR